LATIACGIGPFALSLLMVVRHLCCFTVFCISLGRNLGRGYLLDQATRKQS
jgi:hypothetical protein